MKIQTRLTAEADFAARRYQNMTDSWRGVYLAAFDRRDFGSPAGLESARKQAYQIAQNFLEAEKIHIHQSVSDILTEALTATEKSLALDHTLEISDALSELVDEFESYLLREIALQIERDIATLIQTLRGAMLQVKLSTQSRQIPVRVATIEYRVGNSSGVQFSFFDRLSRKWSSVKFIRGLYRHTLLSVFNETVLITLVDYGENLAMVDHLDKKSPVHGMIIAMSSNQSHPTYDEIRNEVFHPNSDAILTRAGEA